MNREAPFPVVPPEVGSGRNESEFLHDVLTDVREKHVAVHGVPRETLRVAHTVGVDFAQRGCVPISGERVAGRDPVLAIGAVRAERVDT